MKHLFTSLCVFSFLFTFAIPKGQAASNVIEKQLAEIGAVQNDEVVVVQRKYTKKNFRSELTPITIGGIPFGTVRNALFGGASYTLHFNDWLGWEAFNFQYSKTFFTSFTGDINSNKSAGSNQADITPDYQKLLYFLTTGFQITPFYGKMSTFSRYIAYVEPYFGFGAGLAKTESNQYLTFYPAVGLRTFFREWVSLKVELRDYLYTENYLTSNNASTSQTASAFRQNWAVMVSLSFWLPKMPR